MKQVDHSRRYYSLLNAAISISLQIFHLLFSFVERTVFINVLGEEFLGISGLFTSFLAFLNLADLGLSSAFTYSLYKPLAAHDSERIRTLVNFYKKFYRILFFAVFGIGLLISPIVVFSVKGVSISQGETFLYYILVLLNSACSYLAVYKTTLLRADQRVYIVNLSTTIASVVCTTIQIFLLLTTNRYVLYLVVRIIVTLLGNFIVSAFANHRYKPIFSNSTKTSLDKPTRDYFITSLKNLFIYKISTTVINNSTNIIMSLLLGTAMVGLYSNYSLITNMINTFIGLVNASLIGSIGNLGATSTPQKKKEVFFKLISAYYIISIFCSVCLYFNLSDFVLLWLRRPDYILDNQAIFSYVFYFFLTIVSAPIWMTREANGLFTKVYPVLIARAVINISLSVLLGIKLGMAGIFVGSSIAILATNMWYEPKMLCKDTFYCKYSEFGKAFLVGMIKSIAVFVVCWFIFHDMGSTFIMMITKCIITGAVVVVFFSNDIIKILRHE